MVILGFVAFLVAVSAAPATGQTGAPAPAIDITKRTNGTDNNSAPGPSVPVGSTVTFTYEVTNPGGISLGNVAVVDDNGTPGVPGDDFSPTFTGGDGGNGLLDLAETWTYSAQRIATAGQYGNIATATGTPGTQPPVSDTDPDFHVGVAPTIQIVKRTNGTDNDSPPGLDVPAGSTVTFTYLVTNPNSFALGTIFVVDDNGTPGDLGDDFQPAFTGGDTSMDGLLDPTETWTFSAERVAILGQYTNIAQVTGSPIGAGPIADTDSESYFGLVAAPEIPTLRQPVLALLALVLAAGALWRIRR